MDANRKFLDNLYLNGKLTWCDTSNDDYVYSEYVLNNVEYRLYTYPTYTNIFTRIGSVITAMVFNNEDSE